MASSNVLLAASQCGRRHHRTKRGRERGQGHTYSCPGGISPFRRVKPSWPSPSPQSHLLIKSQWQLNFNASFVGNQHSNHSLLQWGHRLISFIDIRLFRFSIFLKSVSILCNFQRIYPFHLCLEFTGISLFRIPPPIFLTLWDVRWRAFLLDVANPCSPSCFSSSLWSGAYRSFQRTLGSNFLYGFALFDFLSFHSLLTLFNLLFLSQSLKTEAWIMNFRSFLFS